MTASAYTEPRYGSQGSPKPPTQVLEVSPSLQAHVPSAQQDMPSMHNGPLYGSQQITPKVSSSPELEPDASPELPLPELDPSSLLDDPPLVPDDSDVPDPDPDPDEVESPEPADA